MKREERLAQWRRFFDERARHGARIEHTVAELLLRGYSRGVIQLVVSNYHQFVKRRQSLAIIAVYAILLIGLFAVTWFQPSITGYAIGDTVDEPITVIANLSRSLGVVNGHFYGVNTHGTWGSNGSWIDTDGDGDDDTASNFSWHRDAMQHAGITILRADMSLQNYQFGISNKDAEQWTLNNKTLTAGVGSTSYRGVPYGWEFEIVGASSVGTVSRSILAHGGSYSANITNTGTGSAFSTYDTELPSGHAYNVSVWVKSSSHVMIDIQRKDTWAYGCSATHSGGGGWEHLSCMATVSENISAGWRINIETQSGQSLLWDDLAFTQDGNPYEPTPTLARDKSMVSWAHENNLTIIYIASYMPADLANMSAECGSLVRTCPPENYSAWGERVVDFLNVVTNDGVYADSIMLEVWNEPDIGQFFLYDLSGNAARRTELYNALYNATYTAVKARYPAMPVGGPTISYLGTTGKTMVAGFVGNFSDRMDFVSYHRYRYLSDGNYRSVLQGDYNTIQSYCSNAHAACNRILCDEWNEWDADTKINNPNKWGMEIASTYAFGLEHGENVSVAMYQWSESMPYSAGAGVYPEYPERWSMVSEPQLDNSYYTSYNVTKDFATYHAAGSMVFNTSSDGSDVLGVVSNDSYYDFTVINGKSSAVYIALRLEGATLSGVTELASGVNFTFTGGVASLGQFAAYAVKHYRGYVNSVVENHASATPSPSLHSASGQNLSTEALECSATLHDDDHDSMNVSVGWYLEGMIITSIDYNQSYADGTVFATYLGSGNLSVGDNWSCSMRLSDGQNLSGWGNSNTVTIREIVISENHAPNTPSPQIASVDGSNTTAAALNCSAVISDGDNDALNVTVRWIRNGFFNKSVDYNNSYVNGSRVLATLDSAYLVVGDNWSCDMRVSDGMNYSTWGESGLITIREAETPPENNAPDTPAPVLTSIDGSNTASAALNCSAVITDVDNDVLNVTLRWIKNGIIYLSTNHNDNYVNGTTVSTIVASSDLTVGDSWRCSVRASDGMNYSEWGNSTSLTILAVSEPDVIVPSRGGGGGGGGISTAADVSIPVDDGTLSRTWNVLAGNVSWDVPGSAVTRIELAALGEAKGVTLRIRDGKGSNVPDAPDVYRYLNITLLDGDISVAVISFRVENSWVAGREVVLSHFAGRWVDLPTVMTNSDQRYSYYRAATPSLSTFAIRSIEAKPGAASTGQTAPQGENQMPATPALESPRGQSADLDKVPLTTLWIGLGLIAGLLLVFGALAMIKRRPQRMTSIEDYLWKCMEQGFSKQQVVMQLRQNGWTDAQITEVFDMYKGESERNLNPAANPMGRSASTSTERVVLGAEPQSQKDDLQAQTQQNEDASVAGTQMNTPPLERGW